MILLADSECFPTGYIGIVPDQIERALNKLFSLAHSWGCVFLRDEADISYNNELSTNSLEIPCIW